MAQSAAKGDLALAIDEDELEASLTFTPDKEGADWTADKVLRVFMDARIGGYNQKRADELVQNSRGRRAGSRRSSPRARRLSCPSPRCRSGPTCLFRPSWPTSPRASRPRLRRRFFIK